ncbi:MAG: AraC family transcriptional regulator [Pseudomonadota bacterium]
MKKGSTRADYYARIERVMAYMADHLFEDLRLETLAEVAAFSPYHFHRIYRALARETVAETIRRLRLHHAAGRLVRSQAPVAEIAKQVGYSNAAAFTRAFTQAFGMSPAAYRAAGPSPAPTHQWSTKDNMMTYDVTFRDWSTTRLATIRHTGPYMEIGRAFERLSAWAVSHNMFGPDTKMVAIYWDDPQSTAPEALRSDAGLTVTPDFNPDDIVTVQDIPALRSASIDHKGPYAGLQSAYTWLYGTWLPESGSETADFPPFEEYLNDPKSTPPQELITRIHVPVAS